MNLNTLLNKSKFKHLKNLWEGFNYYFNSENSIFDDIINNDTATIAFILVQYEINRKFISEKIFNYVQLGDENKNNKIPFIEIRDEILLKNKININLLNMDYNTNSTDCIKYLKSWKGYRIYGDMENSLASFLSPFFSFKDFEQNLYLVEEKLNIGTENKKLDHIEGLIKNHWQGLFDFLSNETNYFFKNLEILIIKNIS
ncbi:MAG: hypothetical protein IPM32_14370 [Ignavibacteriae bacterium]|nr:hypothetical protein [Ignavibacteriota bacterium]